MRKTLAVSLSIVALFVTRAVAQKSIDPQKSTLTVRVLKSGLFSAFGHEHEISAPIQRGSLNEQTPSVELTVDARQMKVLDKDVSDKDRAEIQKTMLGPEVLDSDKFSEIRFVSSSIEHPGANQWVVNGKLTLHGQTQPVTIKVDQAGGHYRGSVEIKQRDFGITPVSVAGGAVKVKNEVRIEFDIVPNS